MTLLVGGLTGALIFQLFPSGPLTLTLPPCLKYAATPGVTNNSFSSKLDLGLSDSWIGVRGGEGIRMGEGRC